MPSPSPDIVVVGGGIIGLNAAYDLAKAGAKVTLLDRAQPGREASWAAAGILLPGNVHKSRAPLAKLLGLTSLIYPTLSAELRNETGIDNEYVRCGSIDIACTPDDEHALRSAAGRYRRIDILAEPLTPEPACRLEPALSPDIRAAFHIPAVAQVRCPRHLRALVEACRLRGVSIYANSKAVGFERRDGRIVAVTTRNGDTYRAGQFLLAVGAWSAELLGSLGLRLPVRPIRGQMLLLRATTPLFTHVLRHEERYIVPRIDGRVLVGSTLEDVGFNTATTADARDSLLAFARRLCPGLASAVLETTWAGLRPATPDGAPYIGTVPGFDNLVVASGHYRSGIQLAPGTAQLVKEILMQETPTIPLAAFRLDRPEVRQS